MTTNEVATQLFALCKEGKFHEAIATLYADDATSLEPMAYGPMPRKTEGKAAILAKGEWWQNAHEIHSMTVDGPFVNPESFVVIFNMDVTNKESGQRITGREAGIYTVVDGKVATEQFLGGI